MENKLRIRRIHVLSLMETLSDLYHKGVDYIDIYGTIQDGQDTVGIIFSKAYMNEEYERNFDNFTSDQTPSKLDVRRLSDEDLDELI